MASREYCADCSKMLNFLTCPRNYRFLISFCPDKSDIWNVVNSAGKFFCGLSAYKWCKFVGLPTRENLKIEVKFKDDCGTGSLVFHKFLQKSIFISRSTLNFWRYQELTGFIVESFSLSLLFNIFKSAKGWRPYSRSVQGRDFY